MRGIHEAGWWRWPLWSWRNIVVTVLTAAVLVACLGRLTAGPEKMATDARSGQQLVTASGDPPPSPPPMPSSASAKPSATPTPLESPENVAMAFVGRWARPDADVEEWRTSCQSMSTLRFASILDAASSAAVPASRVIGDTEVLERSEASARVRVPTDGGAVLVALKQTPAGWRVDGIEPEELNAALAARR